MVGYQDSAGAQHPSGRYVGIDVGSESIKVVELAGGADGLRCVRRERVEHGKEPVARLLEILGRWDWNGVRAAAVCGRMAGQVNLPHIPIKQAQVRGYRLLHGGRAATIVSIGNHGFSVLELRDNGLEIFRENGRCSQGTGNFLRQLVGRFSLTVEEASERCADVAQPAALSGRCPVILKTDMTHLANKGEPQEAILAGLFDAVCENVMALVKPGLNPGRVLLIGGVSCSRRVRATFRRLLAAGGMELAELPEHEALFMEATGAAAIAAETAAGDHSGVPPLDRLFTAPPAASFDRVAPLQDALPRVRRMPAPAPVARNGKPARLILGFDIGSTGSKLVALETRHGASLWEGYRQTAGNPVQAAQALLTSFLEETAGLHEVVAMAVTGSGREIVGSLMATCYGKDAVYILNEIAAHAEGAVHYDPRVDTIFEIGGQDAKYIRLAGGRVVDCAMNEACSAGTGSFIEEQGRKFPGVQDVVQLAREAMAAPCGVSLGQHCSVFMAEIIDGAIDAGVPPRQIIAGLYDSIIQNYLNRVKGNRSVGQVVFCQGMPFSADALAAAVARQTGSEVVIPPNPGTVGALGIALIARRELPVGTLAALEPRRFLDAQILKKETFNCKANIGCGGAGNKCRIDAISTLVDARKQRFTWGGGCSLWDKGTRKRKLPDHSPDPFREREELVSALLERLAQDSASGNGNGHARPRVALTDEFMLKGMLPFFATFLHGLGLELVVRRDADHKVLKRGIQEANIAYCAPMQLYHGVASELAGEDCDYIFAPMLRSTSRCTRDCLARVCPIAQACPDIVRWDLQQKIRAAFVSPVIDIGAGNLDSPEFAESCRRTAGAFGIKGPRWQAAFSLACWEQVVFERQCEAVGRRALEFCAANGIVAVVVLGRPYTIYNKVLNSNVPSLLREQGAIAVPVDCYPPGEDAPVFGDIYWGYAQRILRAAHQVRREKGTWAVFCSNYACGPDSFGLHFFSYIMDGKPFAIIETDGHSGDAGTKTRIEAFLYCVEQDRRSEAPPATVHDFATTRIAGFRLEEVDRGRTILLPNLGLHSEVMAACMGGFGHPAEVLPVPDPANLRFGRRHTSGKECVPMTLTLGSLLGHLQAHAAADRKYVLFMPRTPGPCRFGVYNVLNNIILERLGWRDRVQVAAPFEEDYFTGAPPGFLAMLFTGFMAADLLRAGLLDARPFEATPGAAQTVVDRHARRLVEICRSVCGGDLSLGTVLRQVYGGGLFGVRQLLDEAARELAGVKRPGDRPTVLVVGEFYVRCLPFANDFVIDKLEERGCRVRLAPTYEWLEYVAHINWHQHHQRDLAELVKRGLQSVIRHRAYAAMEKPLGWPPHTPVEVALAAARPYLRTDLEGEAVVTLGSAIHEWRAGTIDAAVSVGPLECMPNKVAEAQFFHVAEKEGLPTLTIPLMGDPMNLATLDNFVFEVKNRRLSRGSTGRPRVCTPA